LQGVPFTIGGDPRVHPEDFRITAFASGLNYPNAMVQLPDGSLLVGTSRPADGNLYDSVGELIRLVDADHDGVADGPGSVLFTGLPGVITAMSWAGPLLFVTSSLPGSERISVLRFARSSVPPALLGSINFAFPAGWEHTTYANTVRPTPLEPGSYDLFFNVGSRENFARTTATVAVSGLVSGDVHGDSVYRVTVHHTFGTPVFSGLRQVADGLRNAAGMAFDPATGNLYLEDNGIDGGGNPEEELSADEINRVRARDLGRTVEDFGFPDSYIDYNTGRHVGQGGIQPLVAFVPGSGPEIAGADQITFAPPAFPQGLNRGIFVGFHGSFSSGGADNDENPVAYVDPRTGEWFRFIANSVNGVGHLDGLLATRDSLFLADLSANGDIFHSRGSGVIYQIQALPRRRGDTPDGSADANSPGSDVFMSLVLQAPPDLPGRGYPTSVGADFHSGPAAPEPGEGSTLSAPGRSSDGTGQGRGAGAIHSLPSSRSLDSQDGWYWVGFEPESLRWTGR
jgi:glucose/arabinose dehydrogenase